jgi:tetratricopeptide (TPR) repeat protein
MLFLPALILLLSHQDAPPVPMISPQDLDRQLDALSKAKDWKGMADLFEGMTPGQRGDRLYNWAVTLERAGRWERLLAVSSGPAPNRLPPHFKGRALSELGRHREALVWFQEAGKRGDVSGYLEGCNEALVLADWKAYQAIADVLIDKYPTNGAYLGMRGEALAKQGRFAEAEVSLTEAVALTPKRAMSWADLACCRNERARYGEAHEAANQAVTLDPKLLEGLCNRGRAAIGLKRYREGRDDYAAALALNPKDPVLVRNLKANVSMADKYLSYQASKPGKGKVAKP